MAVRVSEPLLGTTGVGVRSVRLFGGMLTFPASMSECFTKWKASVTVWTSHRWGPIGTRPPTYVQRGCNVSPSDLELTRRLCRPCPLGSLPPSCHTCCGFSV